MMRPILFHNNKSLSISKSVLKFNCSYKCQAFICQLLVDDTYLIVGDKMNQTVYRLFFGDISTYGCSIVSVLAW